MAHKTVRTKPKTAARKKLTLKKVTLRNLDPRNGDGVKGGSYSQRSVPPKPTDGPRCA
jgi:hypothetical protein